MTTSTTRVERCEKSDLPVEQCGDTCCRPDLAEGLPPEVLPIRYEGTWIKAQFSGQCGCGCGRRFHEGADIACADTEPGVRPRDRTWCLLEHTRSALSELGMGH